MDTATLLGQAGAGSGDVELTWDLPGFYDPVGSLAAEMAFLRYFRVSPLPRCHPSIPVLTHDSFWECLRPLPRASYLVSGLGRGERLKKPSWELWRSGMEQA